VRTGGFGAELAAELQAAAFDYLDAPIQRVGAPFMPVPLSPPLEDGYRPQSDDVYAAARHAVQWADVEEPVPVSEAGVGEAE
jgi:pyruvate dehydrogenase E1 component beta subunit